MAERAPLSPVVVERAIANIHLVIDTNDAVCVSNENIIAADRLNDIPGVGFKDGSFKTLEAHIGDAQDSLDIAVSMAPNLRDERLAGLGGYLGTVSTATKETTNSDVEQAPDLKEQLTATLATGYQVYEELLSAKNSADDNETVNVASEAEVQQEFEAWLTPEILEAAQADLARNADQSNAGFDVIVMANADYTPEEENSVANAIQTHVLPYKGESYVNSSYHNAKTAAKANPAAGKVRFALAPRHTNIPEGDAKTQKQWLEAQNQGSAAQIRTPEDIEAMTRINVLAVNGELKDLSGNELFYVTYSRKVEDYKEKRNGTPVDLYVSSVCVYDGGQLSRGSPRVDYVYPGLALVV